MHWSHRCLADVEAQDHRGLATAVTDGFQLDEVLRPREEPLAALEEIALKVGAQAVTQDRDA